MKNRKKKKRSLALLLSLSMVMSTFSGITVRADAAETKQFQFVSYDSLAQGEALPNKGESVSLSTDNQWVSANKDGDSVGSYIAICDVTQDDTENGEFKVASDTGYTTDDLVEEGKGAITLSPTNIIDGKIDYKKCSYLSWEKYYESPEIMVENGDIVLVKTASVGQCPSVEQPPLEATLNPQFVIFKQITCNSIFLIYILQSYVQNYMNVLKIGSVVPTISQAQIYNFKITLPPLSEQQEITTYLDTKCSEIDKAIDNIGKQIDALKRLKRSLINEVVTGKRKI